MFIIKNKIFGNKPFWKVTKGKSIKGYIFLLLTTNC